MSTTIYSGSLDTVADRHRQRVAAARRHWSQYPLEDVERIGKYVHDRGSGNLFTEITHAVLAAEVIVDGEGVHGFVDVGGDLLFLTRATPGTLSELRDTEAEQERQHADAEQAAKTARSRFLKRQKRLPLTLAELEGKELMTLAAAYETLIDAGCEVDVRNGSLSINVPLRLREDDWEDLATRQAVHAASKLLDYCRDVVVAHLQANQELPSGPITVGGGVAR